VILVNHVPACQVKFREQLLEKFFAALQPTFRLV
jgi:hypothetical protein